MAQNKYSFASSGDLTLFAVAPMVIAGVHYEKDEPVAFFTDVMYSLGYSKNNAQSVSGTTTLLSLSRLTPDRISFDNIEQQESLMNLLFEKECGIINEVKENIKTKTINKQITVLTQYAIKPNSVYAYKAGSRTRVSAVEENGIITFEEDGEYIVFYSVLVPPVAQYAASTQLQRQFRLQYVTVGNINGSTGRMVIDVPRAALETTPSIDTVASNVFSSDISFSIVGSKEDKVVLVSFIK